MHLQSCVQILVLFTATSKAFVSRPCKDGSPGYITHQIDKSAGDASRCCKQITCGQGMRPKVCLSDGGRATCEPCQVDHFQDGQVESGRDYTCREMTKCNVHGQRIGEKGDPTKDNKCICDLEKGFYLKPSHDNGDNDPYCSHHICKAGHELQKNGECEPCSYGKFKNVESAEQCKPWTECVETVKVGTNTEDNICVSSNHTGTNKVHKTNTASVEFPSNNPTSESPGSKGEIGVVDTKEIKDEAKSSDVTVISVVVPLAVIMVIMVIVVGLIIVITRGKYQSTSIACCNVSNQKNSDKERSEEDGVRQHTETYKEHGHADGDKVNSLYTGTSEETQGSRRENTNDTDSGINSAGSSHNNLNGSNSSSPDRENGSDAGHITPNITSTEDDASIASTHSNDPLNNSDKIQLDSCDLREVPNHLNEEHLSESAIITVPTDDENGMQDDLSKPLISKSSVNTSQPNQDAPPPYSPGPTQTCIPIDDIINKSPSTPTSSALQIVINVNNQHHCETINGDKLVISNS